MVNPLRAMIQPCENSVFDWTSLVMESFRRLLSRPELSIPRPPLLQNWTRVGGALWPHLDLKSLALPSDWSNIHILMELSGPDVSSSGCDGRN